MSMKVPTIVKEAQQALEAGYCVVIGLQSTGEVCFNFVLSFGVVKLFQFKYYSFCQV